MSGALSVPPSKLYRELEAKGGRLYVVGDIHGCVSELELLLQELRKKEKINSDDQLVFIGDYIDRGPQSAQVVDVLLQFQKDFPDTVFLRGNHEQMLLGFLGLGPYVAPYFANGGGITLASYGAEGGLNAEEALKIIPPEHVAFYKATEAMVLSDAYLFVHAGINPLRELDAQVEEDIFWIRDVFIQNIHKLDKTVIFGHTPFEDVLFHLPYKIGIDTGLVYGNALTCLELTEQVVLQIRAGGRRVNRRTFADVQKAQARS